VIKTAHHGEIVRFIPPPGGGGFMEHITGRPPDCGVFPRPGDKSVAYVSSAAL